MFCYVCDDLLAIPSTANYALKSKDEINNGGGKALANHCE